MTRSPKTPPQSPESASSLRERSPSDDPGLVSSGAAPAFLADGPHRKLFGAMVEGYAYCRMIFEDGRPVDWIYLDVNPAYLRLAGLESAVGRRVSELVPHLLETSPEVFATYARVVASGESEHFEFFAQPLQLWLSISVSRPEAGCFLALLEDITARVRAEEELRQSATLLRSTLDGLTAHIAVVGAAGEILAVNRAWREFGERNGLTPGKAVGEGSNYLRACDDAHARGCVSAGAFAAGLRSVLARGVPYFEMEYDCHSPQEERWFVGRVTPTGEGVAGAIVAHENVTGRVLAERRMQDSLGRYASVIQTSSAAIWINRDDRIVEVNPATLRLFGAEREDEIVGRSPLEFVHPEGHAEARGRIAGVLGEWLPAPLAEQRIVRLDGAIVEVEVAAAPFLDEGRQAIHVTMHDISERKRAERRMRLQELLLREAGEMALVGGWEFDPETGEGSWTEEVARIHDLDPALPPSRDIGLNYYYGESRARIEAAVAAAVAHGTPYDLELDLVSATGVKKRVRTACHPEVANGKVVRVRGAIQDVTARFAAEQALVAERSRLRTVLDTIPDKVWIKDLDGVYLGCNPAFERMVGAPLAELLGRTDFDYYPRAVAEEFRAHDRAAIEAGQPTTNEEWIDSAADGRILIETVKTPVRDPEGRLLGVLGIARDVTRTRADAESLRQSEEHYRALAETTFDWIWEVDAEARYTFVSPRVEQLLGYAPEEVLGRRPFELMPAEEAGRVERALRGVRPAARAVRRPGERQPAQGRPPGRAGEQRRALFRLARRLPRLPRHGPGHHGAQAGRAPIRDAGGGQPAADGVVFDCRSGAAGSGGDRCRRGLVLRRPVGGREGAARSCAASPAGRIPGSRRRPSSRRRSSCDSGAARASRGESGKPPGRSRIRTCPRMPGFCAEASIQELGLHGAIGFPIRLGDEILGVVEFLDTRRFEPDAGLLEAFEAIGRQIGLFVERRHAEATLRRFVSGSPAVIYALRVRPDRLQPLLGQRQPRAHDRMEPSARWTEWPGGSRTSTPRIASACWRPTALPYEIEHQVVEFRFRRRDGGYVWLRDEKRLLRDADGRPSEIVGSWTDVTERVTLEDQLRVAQKMEAVGRLAGGVAHDFNNLLTVVLHSCGFITDALPQQSPIQEDVEQIRQAGERASKLTRQLLAFSRQQVLNPEVLDLGVHVGNMRGLLKRLLGEQCVLVVRTTPTLWKVKADGTHVEQIVMNLAINARDAMPRGGTLTVETSNIVLDEQRGGSKAGPYVRLSVSDTGEGMTKETQERIFEPFFTTKPVGKGTGLGLSTVFGIVEQNGGHIGVESVEGHGTTFEICLPQLPAPVVETVRPKETGEAPSGRETVLLVEDEAGVRRVARLALERQGYNVLAASGGREAIGIAEQHGDAIDLLLTDLVMPEMSGRELAEILRARRPRLAVLMMSGFVEDDFVRHGVVTAEVAFLHKPFSLGELAQAVRDVLDEAKAAADSGRS
jgi:PAS domain S-box-containing protein